MRIKKSESLLGVLSRQLLLSVRQIGSGKIGVRIGRIRISQNVELERLDGVLDVSDAVIVFADNIYRSFRPQLGLGIFTPSFQ